MNAKTAQHTPEDWVAGSVMVDGRVPDDEAIVYIGGDADTGPEVEIIIRGPGAARISGIIAAAPDMLAALKGAMTVTSLLNIPDGIGDEVRAATTRRCEAILSAISKAEQSS